MLKTRLLHPGIWRALAAAGHGSRVLLADSNYPVSTTLGRHVEVVHLNLVPGVVDAETVLQALLEVLPVEEALVMQPAAEGLYAMDGEPPVWSRYRKALASAGAVVDLHGVDRMAFYEQVRGPDTALVIATGETEIYANLLLRIGVVAQPATTGRSN